MIKRGDIEDTEDLNMHDRNISVEDLRAHTASVTAQLSRHTDEMKDALASEKRTLEEGLQKRVEDARNVIDGQRWTVTTVLSILAAFALGAAYLFGSEFSKLEETLTTEVQSNIVQVESSIEQTVGQLDEIIADVENELQRFGEIQEQKILEINTRLDAELERFSKFQEAQLLLIPSTVRSVVLEDAQTARRAVAMWERVEPMLTNLEEMNDRYASVLGNAGVIVGEFDELPYSIDEAYLQLKEIEDVWLSTDGPLPEDERVRAAALLATMISESLEDAVDPNTLFNASVSASRLGFFDSAIKLAILAETYQPNTTHKIMRLEREVSAGVAYTLKNGIFEKLNSDPSTLRATAWQEMLSVIKQMPRQDSEQVFSRTWNVATRNNSLGYYSDMIDAIEAGLELNPGKATSYVYITLAQLYAHRANQDWENDYLRTITKGISTILDEPQTASWYQDSIDDMISTARNLGLEEQIFEIMQANSLQP